MSLVGCGESVVTTASDEPDPVVVDIPVAFIERSIPVDENSAPVTLDLREPAQFIPGAALFIKSRAVASAPAVNITDRAFVDGEVSSELTAETRPQYDVKDIDVSYDGTRLIFAMRAPALENADESEQPTWNIWEYDRINDDLRRIIASDIVAEAGQDTAPTYLPDGRIVFSSTRQRTNQAILLDEGKPQYAGLDESRRTHASVLHIMDANGADIQQISFNQSHDLDPQVQPDGSILFTRWDQAGGDRGMHLYRVNPDGSGLAIVYGRHSHMDGDGEQHFVGSRITPDGQILVSARPYQRATLGGNYALLNTTDYVDTFTPVADAESLSGPAQTPALFESIDTAVAISPGGYVASVYPLWDGSGRQLFSWSQCRVYGEAPTDGSERPVLPCTPERLAEENVEPAPALYGLWMYQPDSGTQQVVVPPVEGVAYTEFVSMETRPFPDSYAGPAEYDAQLADAQRGTLHIRSVYDMGGEDTSPAGLATLANPALTAPDMRPVRFIRIEKGVSQPDEDVLELDNDAFGPNRRLGMREIIGYAELEPDGSVMVDVPANIPLAFSLTDSRGKRVLPRHDNWLQVAPGEVKTCHGCHTSDSTVPHGRPDAEYPSINAGAATTGGAFPGANPALFTDLGDTMAQTRRRVLGAQPASADMQFTDVWSDPAVTTPAADFSISYAELNTALPVTQSCAQTWTPTCRSVINYPTHIQPLFTQPREQLDDDDNVLAVHTCVACHAPVDANGDAQVPAAQLDLSDAPSTDNPEHLTGYRELLFNDNAQEVVEGVLRDVRETVRDDNGDIVFERDEDGELILDAEGNPIPVTEPVPVPAVARAGSASQSAALFNALESGTHAGWMSAAELKLLAEWLDVGGQYYNNPFDSVQE
ncbi:hypothetical protein OCL06_15850 [Alteromonas sp. ASW11-19]|uniref:Hydrazine synthase alpha subunit middle domain-containing protein n=1 Tax=Alteromonas salexigens TaxID=2982530 RepID=A0ABT2VSE7_9ALTE|nr:hypothetical protein [Alteromonas salexigens]MCU7556065.1 hypothetical protein [Alteromonas salexigens]